MMKNKQQNPRTLLVTTSDAIGGMARVVCSLARELNARDWPVHTVFPQMDNREALLGWCREQGVDAETDPAVLDIVSPHTRRDMRALRSFVQRSKSDVVNIYYGESYISLKDIIAVRLAGRARCVASVLHPTPWETLGEQKRTMTRLAARLCHAVVTISKATEAVLLQAGIPAHKIHVIPCGTHVPSHTPTRAEARARLGLPPSAFVVGSVARLVSHKGIADLIEASARLHDPHGQILVVVGGEGPERADLEALAAHRLKDRVVFLGHVPEVDDLYAASDVFALPSHMEGFGLVYVEAAFHGVPSIGANVGGVPEVIVDGTTGLLVPPADPSALAVALCRLWEDNAFRQQLGQAARAHAHAEFTETRMADLYCRIFTHQKGFVA